MYGAPPREVMHPGDDSSNPQEGPEVSDEKSGGGFGPKKPKATFGDVMRGIPAGKGGSGDEAPRRRDSGDRGPRRDRPERKPREERTAAPAEEKKGPLVVVRRASGAVETRTVEAAPASATAESTEAAATEAPKHVPNDALFAEVAEDQSFADMFEASVKAEPARKSVRVGDKVKAKIFQLGADTAFVSLGGKSEAMIDLRELKDDEGILRFGVGDEIEAYVMETGAKGILLSRSLGKGAASLNRLADARVSGIPVEGLVLGVNKGGFEVAVGDVRAFCPVSQMDIRFVEKPEVFVGERHQFRVTEVRDRNVVLSRRVLLEAEQKRLGEETRKTLEVGKVLKARVTGVRDFGAFADIGGLEGMIPVSEISHVRVAHPSDVVKVGDEVEVEVLRLEAAEPHAADKSKRKERITLSLRARQEDPWKAAVAEIQEGSLLKGRVVRLQQFGAFVELRPGVDGLIHVSALSERRIAHPRDAVRVGDEVEVQVEKVDGAEKRIALRLVKDGKVMGEGMASPPPPAEEGQQGQAAAPAQPAGPRPKVGMVVVGKVDRIESYGVFVAFPGGKGLIPASETGTDRGTDLKRTFSAGQELKAAIISIEDGKIRLSLTEAARAEERAAVAEWQKSQKQAGGGGKGFGTLADKLKGFKLG